MSSDLEEGASSAMAPTGPGPERQFSLRSVLSRSAGSSSSAPRLPTGPRFSLTGVFDVGAVACATLEVCFEGWGVKKGEGTMSSWKRRYFVMRNTSVLYFEEPKGKLIGEFRFGVDSEIKLAEQENYKNTQFALSIATPHRLYVLRFDSIQGRQDWMTMLKYAQLAQKTKDTLAALAPVLEEQSLKLAKAFQSTLWLTVDWESFHRTEKFADMAPALVSHIREKLVPALMQLAPASEDSPEAVMDTRTVREGLGLVVVRCVEEDDTRSSYDPTSKTLIDIFPWPESHPVSERIAEELRQKSKVIKTVMLEFEDRIRSTLSSSLKWDLVVGDCVEQRQVHVLVDESSLRTILHPTRAAYALLGVLLPNITVALQWIGASKPAVADLMRRALTEFRVQHLPTAVCPQGQVSCSSGKLHLVFATGEDPEDIAVPRTSSIKEELVAWFDREFEVNRLQDESLPAVQRALQETFGDQISVEVDMDSFLKSSHSVAALKHLQSPDGMMRIVKVLLFEARDKTGANVVTENVRVICFRHGKSEEGVRFSLEGVLTDSCFATSDDDVKFVPSRAVTKNLRRWLSLEGRRLETVLDKLKASMAGSLQTIRSLFDVDLKLDLDTDSFSDNVLGLDALLEMEARGVPSVFDLGIRAFLQESLTLDHFEGEPTNKGLPMSRPVSQENVQAIKDAAAGFLREKLRTVVIRLSRFQSAELVGPLVEYIPEGSAVLFTVALATPQPSSSDGVSGGSIPAQELTLLFATQDQVIHALLQQCTIREQKCLFCLDRVIQPQYQRDLNSLADSLVTGAAVELRIKAKKLLHSVEHRSADLLAMVSNYGRPVVGSLVEAFKTVLSDEALGPHLLDRVQVVELVSTPMHIGAKHSLLALDEESSNEDVSLPPRKIRVVCSLEAGAEAALEKNTLVAFLKRVATENKTRRQNRELDLREREEMRSLLETYRDRLEILESGRDPNDLKQLELLDRQIADLRAQIATMEDSKDSVRAEMRAEMARVEDRRIAADAQRQVAETRMQEVQAERDQLQLRISALLEEVVAARQSQSQQQQLSLVDVLKEGAIFMKHGRKGNPHPRFVRLNARGNAIEWMSPDLRGPIRSVPVSSSVQLHKSNVSPVFSRKNYAKDKDRSFWLEFSDRTLDLEAPTRAIYRAWISGLESLLGPSHPAGP